MKQKLEFDTWLDANNQNLYAERMENNMDQELDFDQEQWEFDKYEAYLNS